MNKSKTKLVILATTLLSIFALSLVHSVFATALGSDALVSSPNLMVSGSSTVFPITSSAQSAFQTATGIVLTPENIGSGPGLDKLAAGTTDIAASSKIPESKYWDGPQGGTPNGLEDMRIFAIAKDSVAIIVPTSNTWLTSASTLAIANIFRSTSQTGGVALYTYWDDVPGLTGAPHTVIDRITRFMDDGTHDCFNKFFMSANNFNTGTVSGTSDWLPSTHQEVATNQLMVSTVAGDANAIGYAAMGIYEGAQTQLKGVAINGVAPSKAHVIDATYKGDVANGSPLIMRYLWYAMNSIPHVNQPAVIKAKWVSFVRANPAFITDNGYITLPPGDLTSSTVPCSNDHTAPIHANLPDGKVNFDDLLYFVSGYVYDHMPLADRKLDPYCDFNADGQVNFDDLLLFVNSYVVSPH
jgi:ABC-type phosphate transport system substrate-binding protein